MKNEVLDAFDVLCTKIAQSDRSAVGENELEPLYEEFLNFLSKHAESCRAEFVQRLIEVMGKYRLNREHQEMLLPSTAIAYAMHELRWPEVFAFAADENQAFYETRKATLMTSIMDAYENDWEDKDFYKRFQQ